MKRVQCEMCGGADLIKQDGVFTCQSCGVKYSLEEAKKIMVEVDGAVEVRGTVEVDTSKELDNLYQIARRAKDDNNSENAAKYYDMISVKDPSSWEAAFYAVYFKSMTCKVAQIRSAGKNVSNCIDTVLKLIKDNVKDEKSQEEAYTEVSNSVMTVALMLYNGARNNYSSADEVSEMLSSSLAAINCLYALGDNLDLFFDLDKKANILSLKAWKQGIELHQTLITYMLWDSKEENRNTVRKYASKVKKYDPGYATPKEKACYIATCVYGSYDCPQVWTLRRYRDSTLASTWYGRAFIYTYYAISPITVKWFGNTRWFKNLWRNKLDKMVSNLNSDGIEDTPYQDKQWE